MALLPPNQLLHLGPDPSSSVGWNHFDLGQGLSSHINYPQSQLGNSPPQGAPWWYSKTNVDGLPVAVFSAPLGGATTTSNTQYARDELREYERDGTTKMAFDPRSGDHWIEGIYRIYGLSGLQKPSVCVQQAHDPNDDTIMVLVILSGGVTKLVLRYNGTQVAVLDSNYNVGEEFYLKTRVLNGTPMVYYSANPSTIPSTPVTTSPGSSGYFSGATIGWYYKSGSYNQTNEVTDPNVDKDASIIQVEVRELKHWHSETPKGGAWPTPATYAATPPPGSATVNAGADATISPTGTFSRTATVTLNGATLSSQQWKILSGPLGAGDILSSAALCNWSPATGRTTTTGQTLGVGGVAIPAGATLGAGGTSEWSIPSGGTVSNPKVYDGQGRTVGRVDCTVSNVVIQNYRINAQSQYGAYLDGDNITFQNNDIKGLTPTGDGDLNAITAFGNNIKIRYNTAINFVSGDPGGSHTDFIQTWVSSSHPVASSGWEIVGNKATGPSNPSRVNSIASIHQCVMAEGLNRGGNSGGNGDPNNWLISDNEFGDSWNQSVKLDGVDNVNITRNNFVGSSDFVFDITTASSNVKVWSDNTFGSGYGGVNATITSGSGPAASGGGGGTTTTPYPEGTYILEFDAVTSTGTATDTVTVIVTSTPGGGGGGGPGASTYPTFVGAGPVATSDGSGTVIVAAPIGVTSSHFQICIIQDATEEAITFVPANWFLLDDQGATNTDTGQPGGPSHAWIYYNTTGDSASRSWSKNGTSSYHAIRLAWTNWSTLGPHSSRVSSYTKTPYAPLVTPGTNSALAITVMCSDRKDIGPAPVSIPNGWTERYNAGPTVNVNEIEWIAVADLQVANKAIAGGNVPTGTGTSTSNFTLTNPDDCSMFSFVLEGAISTGVSVAGAVSISAQPRLTVNPTGPGVPVGGVLLTALQTLTVRTLAQGLINLISSVTLNLDARAYPRGALIILSTLTIGIGKLTQVSGLQLIVLPTLRTGALPYRRPVLRTEYKYPPQNHPFRLIAQRILDGEIIDWELPVDEDFEYVEQLSGPIVMKGSFKPEIISVQELNLDGYAYWLHVEINQQIRASGILLPPQYQDSAMNFSAEGIAAAPHYQIYDGVFQQIQVDPLSVVRTIWNYVQSQPQSDLGVVVSGNSSPVRIGEPATTETTVTDNGDGTTTTNIRDIPAKPYELVWWNATNCGEEIDTLSGQTPFDYIERNSWNADRTDVLHYIDLGYPRIGKSRPELLFNEENILEVVPAQESEDSYASAVLVIGAGEGADTIRGYAASSFGDRVRKEVVITDKTITTVERANSRANTELGVRRGRTFEITEIVIAAYHTNAPIGSYGVGDDIQIRVDIPWLMETHISWYRITSISNKPSSDKLRLGLSKADIFDNTSDIQPIIIDDYIPTPIIPPGPVEYAQFVTLIASPSLTIGSTLIPAVQAGILLASFDSLTVGVFATRSATVSLVVAKTLTALGIATASTSSSVGLIINTTLTVGTARAAIASATLSATTTLTADSITSKIGAVTLSTTSTLSASGTAAAAGFGADALGSVPFGGTVGAGTDTVSLSAIPTLLIASGTIPARFGFGSAPFGSTPFGSDTGASTVTLSVVPALTVGISSSSLFALVNLSVAKTLIVSPRLTMVAVMSMSVGMTFSAGGTVSGSGSTTTQLGKTTDGTQTSLSSGNKVTVSKFTATASGNVSAGHARLWVDTGTAAVQLAIYADASGAPGALLGLSDSLTISNTTEAQQNFVFGTQVAITSGIDYWIGFTWADPGTNNINWSRDATVGSAQQANFLAPNPFGTPTAVSGPIDVYVDVVSGGAGSIIPTVRSTATGGKIGATDTTFTVPKPTGLVAGDYLLAVNVGDADQILASMTATGFTTLGSQAANSISNIPAMKIFGKVATSGDVTATNFSFGSDSGADSAAILIAITTGTYNTTTPITMAGAFTTQARTSTMTQTAPSMTGIVNGLLMALFGTDCNGVTESYPSTGPSGMTQVNQIQAPNVYAMIGAYKQTLSSTAATGAKTVSPTPSGITTNGWTTTALIVNPA